MILHALVLGINWMDPNWLLDQFGTAFFWISLVIVFVECGLFFPFLPGDTLLFAVGLFIGTSKVEVVPGGHAVDLLAALVLFVVAAVAGSACGYEIGRAVGAPLYHHDGRILKRRYLDQTRAFFDKHGNKALMIGRFVPFVRTYITLVAGISRLDRRRFLTWSVIGAVLWVLSISLLGYFLGTSSIGDFLSKNIDYAMLVILSFTLIPFAVEWVKRRRQRRGGRRDGSKEPAQASDVEV